MANNIAFKKLKEQDLDLIYKWFKEPVINKYYARGKYWSKSEIKNKYLPRILGEENTPSFIISSSGVNEPKSIGYIQYYVCNNSDFPEGIKSYNNPLFKKAEADKIAGIDLFIADSEHRSKGLGQQIILDFINKFLVNKFEYILVDPEINNTRAIKCYKKCGFVETNYSEDSDYMILVKELELKNKRLV